jgi:hypothetical protein
MYLNKLESENGTGHVMCIFSLPHVQRMVQLCVSCIPDTGSWPDGLGKAKKDRHDMLGSDHRYFFGQDNNGERSGGTA